MEFRKSEISIYSWRFIHWGDRFCVVCHPLALYAHIAGELCTFRAYVNMVLITKPPI